ncbi:hypothetical protein F383_04287 [Gossypium arboreum]|uniref:Uncharacterized protein n=1 Tax=Gossypium arboreum TaxID=29729 RepID=A0A0B0P1J5_GOSAR|nr:hypothetical protein F383_04287 [Gossypium arboreum]
MYLTVCHT